MNNNLKAERTLTAEEVGGAMSIVRNSGLPVFVIADLEAMASMALQSLSTQQPMGEVRVRALEWDGNVATTRLARYQVDKTAMGWTWVVMSGGGFVSTKYYPTEGGAKLAAQEDYSNRIISALHPNQESGE